MQITTKVSKYGHDLGLTSPNQIYLKFVLQQVMRTPHSFLSRVLIFGTLTVYLHLKFQINVKTLEPIRLTIRNANLSLI